jgi:hypothetical protein
MKTNKDYVMELSENKKGKGKRKIVINKKNMHRDDILFLWTLGDLKYNIVPDINMLKAFEKMITDAWKNRNGQSLHLFVPPYVKLKKIRIDDNDDFFNKIKMEGE